MMVYFFPKGLPVAGYSIYTVQGVQRFEGRAVHPGDVLFVDSKRTMRDTRFRRQELYDTRAGSKADTSQRWSACFGDPAPGV